MGFKIIPPVTRAYRYLDKSLPGVMVEREDEPTGWDGATPLIIIKSGGGAGAHTHQLFNARLSFDVRAPTIQQAEHLAYKVEDLLRGWDEAEDRVYLRSAGVPVWDPEPDRRIPAYTFTFVFDFKGELIN